METPAQADRRVRTIGIGGIVVSDDPRDVLITYSLGSCVGVSAWDPIAKVGGLMHCLLPRAKGAQNMSDEGPARFVDRGTVELLQELFDRGARRETLIVKVAGAGHPLQNCEGFRIGERNHAALRKVLWKNGILIASERIGGSDPKTLTLQLNDGRTFVRTGHEEGEI